MILLISEKNGILLKSIADKLKEKEQDTEYAPLKIQSLARLSEASAAILFIDEGTADNREPLVYLKDKLMEFDIPFFLVGNPEEIEDVEKIILQNLITKAFLRPFNVSDAVSDLLWVLSEGQEDKKKKILVVDDSGVVLRDIKAWLGDKYKVYMVDSGMKAIQFLADHRPDLILLDYEMPLMDGRQVLELLKNDKLFATIPVIFLTGKNDSESVKAVLDLKPDGYILKSSGAEKIIAAVDRFFLKQRLEGK